MLRHKRDDPLRLITSWCGTDIGRLSAFTAFYLMPLSQNLPSFIKDCTDSINKIQALNAKGPLPVAFPLVSWDVVSMFPNTDNNLGITAVTKALDTRSSKFSSTDCIKLPKFVSVLTIAISPNKILYKSMVGWWDQKMHVVTRGGVIFGN